MGFSEEKITEELNYIRDFLEEFEIAAEVLPKSKLIEQTSLLICLPSVEDEEDDEEEGEIDYSKLHIAYAYLLDFADTEKRLAKYLLLYTHVRVDASAMSTEEMLALLNDLNAVVRVGHFFYGEVEGEEHPVVQYRALVTGAVDQPFDEGIVADAILEMGVGYDTAKEMIRRANEECKKDGQ